MINELQELNSYANNIFFINKFEDKCITSSLIKKVVSLL